MSETYATYKVWDGCRAPVNLEYNGRLIGQIVRESTIDRDALLALADEIERKADEALDESAHSISEAVATSKLNEYTVRNGIARRIREACGEVG